MKKSLLFLFLYMASLPYITYSQIYPPNSTFNFYNIQKEFYEDFDSTSVDTAEGGTYVHFKRWENHWWPRLAPHGSFFYADSCMREIIDSYQPEDKLSDYIISDWEELGPKENGLDGIGLVNDIVFHPTDTNILFCGSSGGGVWKSTNDGETWVSLNTDQQLLRLGVSTIAVDPDDPEIIFIGTGDIDYKFCFSDGVYRTIDGGENWHAINNGLFTADDSIFLTSKLLVHPDNDSVLFVANSYGIFKCNNRQAQNPTWYKVYPAEQDSFSFIRNIEFRPGNHSELYAVGVDVLKSNTNGELGTWYSIATEQTGFDLTNTPWPNAFPDKYLEIMDMAVGPSDKYLYVNGFTRESSPPYKWDSPYYQFIYRYNVDSNFWSWVGSFSSGDTKPYKFILCVTNDYNNDSVVVGGSVGLYVTFNSCGTWSTFRNSSLGDPHLDYHAIVTSPWESKTIYVGTDGGNWKLKYNNNFIPTSLTEKNQGLGIGTIYKFGSSIIDPYQILIGNQDCGLNYHIIGAWSHQEPPSDGFECLFDYQDANIFYGTIYFPENGSLYRNVSSYASDPDLEIINSQITSEASYFGAPLIMNPVNSHILFQGRLDLWKTEKGHTTTGDDWYEISDFENQFPDTSWLGVVYGLEIAPSDSDYIYVSLRNEATWRTHYNECKLLKTSKGGGTEQGDWEDITPTDTTWYITDIAVSDKNPEEIWVCYSGYNPDFKVKTSSDGGETWSDLSNGIPNVPVNCIVYQNGSNDGIFIGTDIGVLYRNDTLNTWEPFMDGLPNVVVKWLEINYTANKIRAGTFGRGLWESNLPEPCYSSSNDTLFITNDTTWNTTIRMHKHVKISSGATLTIKSRVFFGSGNKILVDRGGYLEINGGYLSNSCNGNTWGGIQVWGNSQKSQYTAGAQGRVRLKNNATISKAQYGISTIYDNGMYTLSHYAGGIIRCNDSYFVNNDVDLSFYPYQNYLPQDSIEKNEINNLSYFDNCVFTDNHGNDSVINRPMVRLSGVGGIDFRQCKFKTADALNDYDHIQNISLNYLQNSREIIYKGCTFENINSQGSPSPRPERGIGIYSYNTSFYIDTLKKDSTTSMETNFNNLYYGIKAFASNSTKYVSIKNTKFDCNLRGVYLGGITDAKIVLNDFELERAIDSVSYGIYLDYCTRYTIEENVVKFKWSTIPTSYSHTGIFVNNSGEDYNEIYNNSFQKLNYGTIAMNDNRGDDDDKGTGLKIKCNNYSDNYYDIVVTSLEEGKGISKYQGYNDSEYAPAGNLFSNKRYYDSSDYYNQLDHIIYFLHDTSAASAQVYKIEPLYYSSGTITLSNTNYQYDSTSCPSNLHEEYRDSLESRIMQAEYNIMNIDNQLAILVDGGNTDGVNLEIEVSQPPDGMDLQNNLLMDSPYLSDTVLLNAAQKEDVLLSAMIRDIMVANPQSAKSTDIINKLNQRSNPLPSYMMEEIEQEKNSISLREDLEAKRSNLFQIRANAFNKLTRLFKYDTLSLSSRDSLISIYSNENTLSLKYALIFEYLNNDDILNATNTLNSITNDFILTNKQYATYGDYEDLINVLVYLIQNNMDAYEIDSVNLSVLQRISEKNTIYVSAYARNILQEINKIKYFEPFILPSSLKNFENPNDGNQNNVQENHSFDIFPNPCYGYFIVSYKFHEETDFVLSITDVQGKQIKIIKLNGMVNQKVIDVSDLTQGTYICNFVTETGYSESHKLVILNN